MLSSATQGDISAIQCFLVLSNTVLFNAILVQSSVVQCYRMQYQCYPVLSSAIQGDVSAIQCFLVLSNTVLSNTSAFQCSASTIQCWPMQSVTTFTLCSDPAQSTLSYASQMGCQLVLKGRCTDQYRALAFACRQCALRMCMLLTITDACANHVLTG